MDWTFYLFWGMVGVLIYLAIKIGKGGGNIGDSRRKATDQYAKYWIDEKKDK
ncbi:MAG: hypothetical protein J7L10_02790 [Methanomicrobia archaeon]|nr:hypothetical protein [Methanomicrobia archaeon]